MSISFFLRPPDCLLNEFRNKLAMVAGTEAVHGLADSRHRLSLNRLMTDVNSRPRYGTISR